MLWYYARVFQVSKKTWKIKAIYVPIQLRLHYKFSLSTICKIFGEYVRRILTVHTCILNFKTCLFSSTLSYQKITKMQKRYHNTNTCVYYRYCSIFTFPSKHGIVSHNPHTNNISQQIKTNIRKTNELFSHFQGNYPQLIIIQTVTCTFYNYQVSGNLKTNHEQRHVSKQKVYKMLVIMLTIIRLLWAFSIR